MCSWVSSVTWGTPTQPTILRLGPSAEPGSRSVRSDAPQGCVCTDGAEVVDAVPAAMTCPVPGGDTATEPRGGAFMDRIKTWSPLLTIQVVVRWR